MIAETSKLAEISMLAEMISWRVSANDYFCEILFLSVQSVQYGLIVYLVNNMMLRLSFQFGRHKEPVIDFQAMQAYKSILFKGYIAKFEYTTTDAVVQTCSHTKTGSSKRIFTATSVTFLAPL